MSNKFHFLFLLVVAIIFSTMSVVSKNTPKEASVETAIEDSVETAIDTLYFKETDGG